MLEDIATLTGGRVITEDIGVKLETVGLDWLGEAKKVVIDKDNTTIVEGKGKASDIQARIKQIHTQIASNAGWEGSIVVEKVKEMKQDMGFNALNEKFDDMIKTGILDPTKVVRIALQNGPSPASCHQGQVADLPEEERAPSIPRAERHVAAVRRAGLATLRGVGSLAAKRRGEAEGALFYPSELSCGLLARHRASPEFI